MAFIGTVINQSPTIVGKLASAISGDASFLAVAYDSNGKIVVAGASDVPVGFIIPGHTENLAADEEVTIQIKDIGLAKAGAAIALGAEIATAANGKVVTATAGKFIIGFALKAAANDNDVISIQISKAGYKPTASVTLVQADWNQTDAEAVDFIKNKPVI